MGRLEDYIEAVTYRLRPDPELHMDVAQEVRAHLEDALEEARARGLSEEEGAEVALKAFGDAEEVGEGIWGANRRRMRLRAVIKWAARLTLVPAAVLLTLFICRLHVVLASVFTLEGYETAISRGMRPRSDLTEEERFVFEHLSADLSDAKALVDRYPDDARYYAYYVGLFLGSLPASEQTSDEQLEEALSILARGEGIEPDNAFYDCVKAGLLIERSSTAVEDEGIRYEYVDRKGEKREVRAGRLVIEDREMFERAMREALEGMRKPCFDAYVMTVADLKMELMKPPTIFLEEIAAVSWGASRLSPHLQHARSVARTLPGYAAVLASEGRADRAAEILALADRPGIQMGAGARNVIEILVARACLARATGPKAAIYEKLNMPKEAAQARKQFEQENALWNSLWNMPDPSAFTREAERHYGLLMGLLAPALPGFGDPVALPAMRKIEHVMVEQGALMALVIIFLVMTLTLGALTCWNLWRCRKRADGPKLFFVGWPRVGWIVLLGLVLPVGIYWACTRLSPWSSMRYGINYLPGRIALELCLVFTAVITAILCMGYQAIRVRCRDAGMEAPSGNLFNPLGSRIARIGLAILLALIALYFVFWESEPLRTMGGGCAAGALMLLTLAYLVGQFWRLRGREPARAHFRRTFIRSLVPILASCLLVVGVSSHIYLRRAEAAQIRLLNRPGHRIFLDELEMTSLNRYRDHLRELNIRWNATHPFGVSARQ